MKISGKNIVITGASSGIGRGLLEQLAADPDNRILAVSRSISAQEGWPANVTVLAADLSTPGGVDALFEQVEALFQPCDLFIANAGAPYYERYDYADWQRVAAIFDLNTVSPIYTYGKYLQHLRGRRGHLVYTVSAISELALPGYALYSSTKFALRGFQQALRWEKPPQLRLTCVYPVATATNFFKVGGQGLEVECPFPLQQTAPVVRRIIRGIEKGRASIYPFPLYRPARVLMDVLPPLRRWYLRGEARKLERFEQRKQQMQQLQQMQTQNSDVQ